MRSTRSTSPVRPGRDAIPDQEAARAAQPSTHFSSPSRGDANRGFTTRRHAAVFVTEIRARADIVRRIRRFVAHRRALVFVRADFEELGSRASVNRALRLLTHEGALVRIGLGLYAKSKRSVLTGKPIPVRPLEVLAPIALQKLGVKIRESKAVREYNSGRTSQVPSGVVLDTGRRRVTRRIGFGGTFVQYERRSRRSR